MISPDFPIPTDVITRADELRVGDLLVIPGMGVHAVTLAEVIPPGPTDDASPLGASIGAGHTRVALRFGRGAWARALRTPPAAALYYVRPMRADRCRECGHKFAGPRDYCEHCGAETAAA